MLPQIHDSLRQMIYERGKISPLEVDIRFDAPTREWIDRLTRPTINLFLCDIEENVEMRPNTFEVMRGNGQSIRRRPPRRIDLHYMVSVLTSDIEDEHLLLWRTLFTLMSHPEVPSEILPKDLQELDTPLVTRVAQPDDHANLLDLWSGLGATPRAALSYILTVPMDLEVAIQAPLVLTRTLRYKNMLDMDSEMSERTGIAGTVRGSHGEPVANVRVAIDGRPHDGSVTDTDGTFRLQRVPQGSVMVRMERTDGTSKSVMVEVPSESYELILD